MSTDFRSTTYILRNTTVQRRRCLPNPGEVLVAPGDRVESMQVVARTHLPGDFRIVPVARLLGVSAKEAEEYLQVDLGSNVHRDDVIAKRAGPFGRAVECPIDGVVMAMGGGRVVVEAQPSPFELRAHIPGTVVSVEQAQVISIETTGALVQASWGTGGESAGEILCLTGRRDKPLKADRIASSAQDQIIVAGMILERAALERAYDVEIRGLVAGGLSPGLVSDVSELPFPVVLTEGLGALPMMGVTFDLLKQNEGRQASISGDVGSVRTWRRPEIIIHLDGESLASENAGGARKLLLGSKVRVEREPYMGSIGTVVNVARHVRRIATGARARCAQVDIGREKPVFVPVVNLGIIVEH